jgi:hypothetical protein
MMSFHSGSATVAGGAIGDHLFDRPNPDADRDVRIELTNHASV